MLLVVMPGPERVDVLLEAELSEPSEGADAAIGALDARSRYVRLDGRKFPNTDSLPTQPLRCLRWRPERNAYEPRDPRDPDEPRDS